MKKIILALALLLSASQAHAKIGFNLGMLLADMNITPTTSTDMRVGLLVGGYYDIDLNAMFAIQPELRFAMRGFGLSGAGGSASLGANYLELPILFKSQFSTGTTFTPQAFFGPVVGFKLGTSCSISTGQTCTLTDATAAHFGLELGAGGKVALTKAQAITFSLRYFFGLTNATGATGSSFKHTGLSILAGMDF